MVQARFIVKFISFGSIQIKEFTLLGCKYKTNINLDKKRFIKNISIRFRQGLIPIINFIYLLEKK